MVHLNLLARTTPIVADALRSEGLGSAPSLAANRDRIKYSLVSLTEAAASAA
jgi:hypothetical protein